jgi:hypothetical protein
MNWILFATALCTGEAFSQTARWSEQKANEWYARQPGLVGSNHIPKTAINELEMWQEATFDPAQIDKKLAWAEALGMNTMRVFLHDLLWQQDAAGFRRRIDRFLALASRHHIRPLFVLFDSCWDPLPQPGPQHPPIPGVHNSGWVQSPGAKALDDAAQYRRLKEYVQGVVGAFAKDDRILGWDIWNEPGSDTTGSYPKTELKMEVKTARVTVLLPQAFAWAREMNPAQPLTSGVYELDPPPTNPLSKRLSGLNCASPTSSRFTTTAGPNPSRPKSRGSEDSIAPWFVPNRWLVRWEARSTGSCPSPSRSGSEPSTGDSSPVKRKRIILGSPGNTLIFSTSRRYGFTRCCDADGTPYRQAEVDLIRQLTRKQ